MDMRGHGLQAILVFRFRSAYDDAEAAGISVAADELRRDASDGSRYVGLWSDHRETLLVTVDDPPPVSSFRGAGRDLGDEPVIAPADHLSADVRRIRREPQRAPRLPRTQP
jgi:hypothetical protein